MSYFSFWGCSINRRHNYTVQLREHWPWGILPCSSSRLAARGSLIMLRIVKSVLSTIASHQILSSLTGLTVMSPPVAWPTLARDSENMVPLPAACPPTFAALTMRQKLCSRLNSRFSNSSPSSRQARNVSSGLRTVFMSDYLRGNGNPLSRADSWTGMLSPYISVLRHRCLDVFSPLLSATPITAPSMSRCR